MFSHISEFPTIEGTKLARILAALKKGVKLNANEMLFVIRHTRARITLFEDAAKEIGLETASLLVDVDVNEEDIKRVYQKRNDLNEENIVSVATLRRMSSRVLLAHNIAVAG